MWGGLRRTLHSFLAIAFFAFLVLTSASQAAPIAEPEAEPGAEASPSGSTIFLCDIRSDGTMTCVTILGELEVCAQLPAGVIRRSYLADPEQQPSVVVKGTTSGDQGTIADVQETYGPGEGTLDIVPAELEDEFGEPAEQFEIGGIYKGDFTETWQDCVPLAAGQEITVFPGGFYSAAELASEEMRDANRNLLILIALNSEEAGAESPEADDGGSGGGQSPGQGGSPTDPPPGSQPGDGDNGDGIDIPPPPLPPVGGGGEDPLFIPNVLGLTLPAATAEITGDGFVVGSVTFQSASAQPPGGVFIRSAQAQEEPVVVDQKPKGGEQKLRGTSVDLVMSGSPIAVSEPSSLALLVVGLFLLAMLATVRRYKKQRSTL
jgi:hypothetical protein